MSSGRDVKSWDALYSLLGRLVVEWSRLEFFLCVMMRGLNGLGVHHANAIFYSAVNNQTRFELLRQAALVQLGDGSEENKPLLNEAVRLIDKAQKLNKTRNRLLHGFYAMDGGGPRILIADLGAMSHSEEHGLSIQGGPLGGADISNHCDAVAALSAEVMAFARDKLGVTPP